MSWRWPRGHGTAPRESFAAALAEQTSPEGLDGLARALWWLDRPTEAIDARVRAYALFRGAGDVARTVRIALWLAHEYSVVQGNEPAAQGWLARAEHLLAGQADVPECGQLELAKAERCLDAAVAAGHAEAALTLSRRLADPDLELAALSRLGLSKITLGQVDEGMRLLDHAMAAATGEEAATFEAVARTCCSVVMAGDLAGDGDRVRQWGKVVAGYVHRHNNLPLLNFCPACEADLLAPRESEAELVHTLAELANTGQRSRCVDPAVRLSQLRVSQGRIEEAEEALVGYGGSPAAVRADTAIRLARGEAAAAALLQRQLSLGRSGLLAVPLLAQLVEARLANGEHDGARAAVAELENLAAQTCNERAPGPRRRALRATEHAVRAGANSARARHRPAQPRGSPGGRPGPVRAQGVRPARGPERGRSSGGPAARSACGDAPARRAPACCPSGSGKSWPWSRRV